MKKLILTLTLLAFCFVEGICGVNKTLQQAQQLYQEATTVAQYETAKKKFQSAKYDVGYVAEEHDAAINEGVKKCNQKIDQLSPRLTVNGYSGSVSVNFEGSGGSRTLTISTNQTTTSASLLPSWITVLSSSATSMKIQCSANSSTSERTDWFYVNAGSKSVRVNVKQAGKSSPSQSYTTSDGKLAEIDSVWVTHNADVDGLKGLTVHVKFSVVGMKGNNGKASVYFYDASGNAVKDTNGSYCTNEDIPKVAVSTSFTPNYDDSRYSDLKISIPYGELHQTGTERRTLLFDVLIWDHSTDSPRTLARYENTPFSYTPHADSYLTVDNKTSVSTSFSGSGGTETFYIRTDADSWTTWGVPSFCEVTNKTSTSFTLKCDPNTTGSRRTDWMKVKTGSHEVRIDITQEAGSCVVINRMWTTHNTWHGGQKGMMIHLDFNAIGLRGHNIRPIAYFEYSNGVALNDYDGYYRTTDGKVSVGQTDDATYENTHWSDFKLFMPYNQLHMGYGSYTLRYQVIIYDKTTNQTMAVSDYESFTYSN